MKKKLFSLLVMSLCFSSFVAAVESGERFSQSEEAVRLATYGHIDAKGLKVLMDSQTPLVLLDARGGRWNDGNILPGAKLAFYQDPQEEIELLIPNKESLVVVYCYSFTCPLSPKLAQKLLEWGYTNVLEYPGGLKEWRDIANYPVEFIEKEATTS